ncbi:hypothetical protein MNBD_GAMMA11-387 [hydrothermal vent metagenome]|uniref:Uncharacterized protein n=1 Tax=hydrothermal vent metagenome TaxID=652676 RepID=A0A3B0X033_9ZZZZ
MLNEPEVRLLYPEVTLAIQVVADTGSLYKILLFSGRIKLSVTHLRLNGWMKI